ncbi:MAG: alkaline phosphatase family protein [Acidimicrobiales bacterium]
MKPAGAFGPDHPRRARPTRVLVVAILTAAALLSACTSRPPATSATEPATSSATTATAATSTAPAPSSSPSTTATFGRDGVPRFAHVFVVLMENLGYAPAMATPGLAALADRYARATDYWAISHPSLPNYLAITSGSTWGISSDCTGCYVSASNLGEQLSAAGVTWGAYLEGVPTSCYLDPYSDDPLYAGKHNPFRYYTDIRRSRALCSHLEPFGQLTRALAEARATIPQFVWITPNLCHDGHNCDPQVAASWLDGFVASVVKTSAWRHGGVMFVTWDESESGGPMGGQVLTLVIAPGLKRGLALGAYYTHYSLLATIEDAFDLPLLRQARSARPMTAFFRSG